MKPATRERAIEAYLHLRVAEVGGDYRRVEWTGRKGAPDDVLFLPFWYARFAGLPTTVWVECKAPDADLSTPHVKAQFREHQRMRDLGQCVHVVWSKEQIDALLPLPPA